MWITISETDKINTDWQFHQVPSSHTVAILLSVVFGIFIFIFSMLIVFPLFLSNNCWHLLVDLMSYYMVTKLRALPRFVFTINLSAHLKKNRVYWRQTTWRVYGYLSLVRSSWYELAQLNHNTTDFWQLWHGY